MEIILDHVYFGYKNNKLFEDLNLKISSNIITGIIGNNSCGKTTLLKLISGDIKPISGNIINNNTFYYKKIDYNKTVYEHLNRCNNLFDIDDILKIIDLDKNKLDCKLYSLSDSEIDKVILGTKLIGNEDLIILDSPNKLLDYKSESLLIKFLRTLKVRYGKTILIASNDIDFIHSVCDTVLLLGNKCIIDDKYKILTNYDLMKENNLKIPKVLDISNIVYKKKNIKLGYRDDIKDLIKDMYRYAK